MAKTRQKAKILIVDDHPLVREGLLSRIGAQPDMEICGDTDNACDALRLVQSEDPDLVLIDLSLKGGSGMELIKEIKARGNGTRMLVISMHDEFLYAERALHAGAMGYLPKGEASAKVLDAIRRVLQGKIYLTEDLTERMISSGAGHGGASAGLAPVERLTDRELEILEMIGEGMKSSQMAKRLHLSAKTIESHRERIKQKLNLKTAGELMRFAVERSLAPPEPPAG